MTDSFPIILTGVVGIITTILGAWASWFFARKKYNSEVDAQMIANMRESLEFYKHLSDDNKERLSQVLIQNKEILAQNAQLLEQNAKLEKEVQELKEQVAILSSKVVITESKGKSPVKKAKNVKNETKG